MAITFFAITSEIKDIAEDVQSRTVTSLKKANQREEQESSRRRKTMAKATKTRIKINWSGEKLRNAMYNKSMTSADLSKRLGVSSPCVRAWIIERNKPTKENIEKLNLLFDVTTQYWEKDKRQKSYSMEQYPSDKAKEAYERNINPHEANKAKVKENLAKLNGEPKEETMNFTESVAQTTEPTMDWSEAWSQSEVKILENSDTHLRLMREINAKNTEIQGLKCELEGLKVENARLKGIIEGMSAQSLEKEEKESWWARLWK